VDDPVGAAGFSTGPGWWLGGVEDPVRGTGFSTGPGLVG